MNLKINLQFVEAEESKYRKNAATADSTGSGKCVETCKTDPGSRRQEDKEEETAATEKRTAKKQRPKTHEPEQKPKTFEKKDAAWRFSWWLP